MSNTTEASWNATRIEDKSQISGVGLLYAEFEEDEYVHIEVDESGQITMWSTTDSLSEYLDKVRSVAGVPSDNEQLASRLVFSDGTEINGVPSIIEAEALRRADDVAYFEAGYDDSIVVWTRPKLKMVYSTTPHAEAAFSSEHTGRERLLALFAQSATSRVVEAVASDSSPIDSRVSI